MEDKYTDKSCEWYGVLLGQHEWLEIPQFGIRRCIKCKLELNLDARYNGDAKGFEIS